MSRNTCIIIDDEPIARQILEGYTGSTPWLQHLGSFKNAQEALPFLRENHVDLILVDINMPEINGLELVRMLKPCPKVIITTAYPEYAVEGFELEVLDYLVKPIAFNRFLNAVNRLNKVPDTSAAQSEYITIKADKRLYRVNYRDILYFQSWGDYIKVFCADVKYVFLQSLTRLQKQLPSNQFCRIHKSYIININHISFIEGNQVIINDIAIPVGNQYKENLFSSI